MHVQTIDPLATRKEKGDFCEGPGSCAVTAHPVALPPARPPARCFGSGVQRPPAFGVADEQGGG